MSTQPDGGSAFPEPSNAQCGGMTLRDYFAAKALAALINHPDKNCINRGAKAVPILSKFAYEYADAMIEARSK